LPHLISDVCSNVVNVNMNTAGRLTLYKAML